MHEVFEPFSLCGLDLTNRIVMASMTRARRPDMIPNHETAVYYAQRASAGLIVSEGLPITPEAQGYMNVPGIWSRDQVIGWRAVTDHVHHAGGKIYAQLWHVGRLSHISLQLGGRAPVSSSDTPVKDGNCHVHAYLLDGSVGRVSPSPPRSLTTAEVERVISDFVSAAANAIKAGFDGVEIQAANGYLFDQFFDSATNFRKDQYGGSIENRVRLLLEVADRIGAIIGSHHVGVKLSPYNTSGDISHYPDLRSLMTFLFSELEKRKIAYIHFSDHIEERISQEICSIASKNKLERKTYVMMSGAMNFQRAAELISSGIIDLVACGKPFISNPDLVDRLKHGWPLAPADSSTFYGGGAVGYTDYPFYVPSNARAG